MTAGKVGVYEDDRSLVGRSLVHGGREHGFSH